MTEDTVMPVVAFVALITGAGLYIFFLGDILVGETLSSFFRRSRK